MIGAVLIVLVVVVVIPVSLLIGGGIVAGLLSAALRKDAEQRHEGSELVDLNT